MRRSALYQKAVRIPIVVPRDNPADFVQEVPKMEVPVLSVFPSVDAAEIYAPA